MHVFEPYLKWSLLSLVSIPIWKISKFLKLNISWIHGLRIYVIPLLSHWISPRHHLGLRREPPFLIIIFVRLNKFPFSAPSLKNIQHVKPEEKIVTFLSPSLKTKLWRSFTTHWHKFGLWTCICNNKPIL